MAITLLGASDAQVEWSGSEAPFGFDVTGFTVVLTFKSTGTATALRRFAGQWGNNTAEQSWLLYEPVANEIGFYIRGLGIGDFIGVQTTDGPIVANAEHRIVATFTAPSTLTITVNGTPRATTPLPSGGTVTEVQPLVFPPTFVGREDDELADGEDGDYSEFAIWTRVLPDWAIAAYCLGFSPKCFAQDGVHYSTLANDEGASLVNQFGGGHKVATNTGGTAAGSHPAVFSPTEYGAFLNAAAAGGGAEFLPKMNRHVNNGLNAGLN